MFRIANVRLNFVNNLPETIHSKVFNDAYQKSQDLLEKCFGTNITYIYVDSIGEKLSNGSYTQALGLMQQNKIDLFYRPDPYHDYPEWIVSSRPVGHAKIGMGNFLSLDENSENWIRLVRNFTPFVWIIYSSAILCILVYLSLFAVLQSKRRKNLNENLWKLVRMMFHNQYTVRNHSNFSFLIYSCTVVIGFWLFNLLFCVLVNTDLVSFSKDSIHDTLEEYQRSPLNPCWFKGEAEAKAFASSSVDSLIHAVWNRHQQLDRPRCLIEKTPEDFNFIANNIKSIYFIGFKGVIQAGMIALFFQSSTFGWLANQIISEVIAGFQMNRRSPLIINNLDRLSKLNLIEAGIDIYSQTRFMTLYGITNNVAFTSDFQHLKKLAFERRKFHVKLRNATSVLLLWSGSWLIVALIILIMQFRNLGFLI